MTFWLIHPNWHNPWHSALNCKFNFMTGFHDSVHVFCIAEIIGPCICQFKSVTMTNCSQVETPMRTTRMQMSFPETVSDSLCRNSLVMQTDCCSSCPGGWPQTILEVKMLDVEVLGWCGYTWSAVVRPVGCTAKFSETPLKTAYDREMNIKFMGNSSGGHSCSQHANCTLPQNLRHLWHCAVW